MPRSQAKPSHAAVAGSARIRGTIERSSHLAPLRSLATSATSGDICYYQTQKSGDIGQNFNKTSVFIDSKAGGENTLSGGPAYDFTNVSQNFAGLTFDAGFEADYHIFGRWGGGAFEVDWVALISTSTLATSSSRSPFPSRHRWRC